MNASQHFDAMTGKHCTLTAERECYELEELYIADANRNVTVTW
jgi:hypothetical protein